MRVERRGRAGSNNNNTTLIEIGSCVNCGVWKKGRKETHTKHRERQTNLGDTRLLMMLVDASHHKVCLAFFLLSMVYPGRMS